MDNMGEPGGHYAARNKSSHERTHSGMFHCHEVPRVVTFVETESRAVDPGGWGGGTGVTV